MPQPLQDTGSDGSPLTGPEGDHSRLILVSREPFNAETRLDEHLGLVTPVYAFYKRNHFPIPILSSSEWRLELGGLVEHPAIFTYDSLRALPSRTLLVTLECAGNARAGLAPSVPGEPWGYGAVSTAEWTGVPLARLLDAAGVSSAACEIVISGADSGHIADAGATLAYTRSLPVEYALRSDSLLAYAMNGEPLPPAHGFPLRLVVPGWYGMAAVKWVTRIEAVATPFRGFYQAERYVVPPPDPGRSAAVVPLSTVAVRSLIASPTDGAILPTGAHIIRGFAWSGAAPIAHIELSLDGGHVWQTAEWTSEPSRYAWRRWEYAWHAAAPGAVTIAGRATDTAGNTQPTDPPWNALGYANNAIQSVRITVA